MKFSIKLRVPAWTLVPALVAAALLGGALGAAMGGPGIALAAGIALLAAAAGFAALSFLESRKEAAPETPPRKELSEDMVDPVTGLANLNGFNAWIAEASAKQAKAGGRIVVLAADLANYGQLIQARGVEKANAVLKEVATRVDVLSGEEGIAARIEGEEFAAIASIVKGDPLAAARAEAGKLAEMLQRPVELPDGVVWIGGSVGAAEGDPKDGLAVFARAKAALARARAIGRGHFVIDGAEA